jgi:hypothetical protein
VQDRLFKGTRVVGGDMLGQGMDMTYTALEIETEIDRARLFYDLIFDHLSAR